ncbi:MAG TPA: MotA/TolQ/ExbB proton channel family protein [Polyangiaceae bacterium]|nr:MotA/TolQ/ExbB proton channel family protein [Polyangiaceae bacterium]
MNPAAASKGPTLDPIQLVLGASGVVLVVLSLLAVASILVWLIWFLKTAQLGRLRSAERHFELEAETAERAQDLIAMAFKHKDAPGARVVVELSKRHHQRGVGSELLSAVAKRALATEQQRVTSLMATLSSIAAASPFVGLFGTVWGIMQAFLRIGVEKSASLPVVAPAIGEALIATAVGLVAAIPATVAYNFVDKRIGDLLEEVSSSAETWVQVLSRDPVESARAQPQAQPAYGYQRR